MNNGTYIMKYPRRVVIRKSMTTLGKLLLSLLANVEINGEANLPDKGPYILAGNHVAALEAVMMAVFNPAIVEFFGNGDIPFDPNYAFIVKAYGLIPVNRGNLDRESLQTAVDILNQGGILGIFPEGGIWDPSQMHAQTGVALLSYRARSPVIPIGFSGIKDSLQKAIALKRPKLVVNVGEVIPPVSLSDDTLSIKTNLENAARHILYEINALITENDRLSNNRRVGEVFHLEVKATSSGVKIPIPDDLLVIHGPAYARLLYNPTLLDVLARNLRLPIKSLKKVSLHSNLIKVIEAFDAILDYLNVNPGFFTYRFGVEEGLNVKYALVELCQLAEWALRSGHQLQLKPERCYRNANTGAQVVEHGGCFPTSMS